MYQEVIVNNHEKEVGKTTARTLRSTKSIINKFHNNNRELQNGRRKKEK
jgi:hypothetical protein